MLKNINLILLLLMIYTLCHEKDSTQHFNVEFCGVNSERFDGLLFNHVIYTVVTSYSLSNSCSGSSLNFFGLFISRGLSVHRLKECFH